MKRIYPLIKLIVQFPTYTMNTLNTNDWSLWDDKWWEVKCWRLNYVQKNPQKRKWMKIREIGSSAEDGKSRILNFSRTNSLIWWVKKEHSLRIPGVLVSEWFARICFPIWRIFQQLLRGILRFKFGGFCRHFFAYFGFSLIFKRVQCRTDRVGSNQWRQEFNRAIDQSDR